MMIDTSPDVNIDQAILEHRIAAAQEFARACAVDPHGRRVVVAQEVRIRRSAPVPTCANDDEKTERDVGHAVLDMQRHFRDNPLKGDPDGREHPAP